MYNGKRTLEQVKAEPVTPQDVGLLVAGTFAASIYLAIAVYTGAWYWWVFAVGSLLVVGVAAYCCIALIRAARRLRAFDEEAAGRKDELVELFRSMTIFRDETAWDEEEQP